MNRGFVGTLVLIMVVLGIAGGIAWWALQQRPGTPSAPTPTPGAQAVSALFTYSARNTDFPLGLFQLTNGDRVLGANYVRVRNASNAIYDLLGSDAGTALSPSCHWSVNASIEVANPKFDNSLYADMSPIPSVAVADFVRAVSHDAPQQVCTP